MIGLILFGTIGRYALFGLGLQPFPNFEVIMVVTFLAVMLIRSPLALLVPLISMVGSDILIGNPIFIGNQMNRIVLFTYSGFALIGLINLFSRDKLWNGFKQINPKIVGLAAGLGIGFVLIYDIWTNIGWWYLLYPHDLTSLIAVFTAGLPFMVYHMVSGLITFIAIAVPILMYATIKKDTTQLHPFKLTTMHKIPAVLIVLCLVALCFSGSATEVPQKSEIWFEKSDQTSIRIVIIGANWTIDDNFISYKGDTAFSILERCAEKNGLTIDSSYYKQFDSILVNSINNEIGGTNGKYWQYYVNDELPMVGADKCFITNGDSLRWSFEVPSS